MFSSNESGQEVLLDGLLAEHREESIEVFDASYCSETNAKESLSEASQDRKSHGHTNLPAQLAGKRLESL